MFTPFWSFEIEKKTNDRIATITHNFQFLQQWNLKYESGLRIILLHSQKVIFVRLLFIYVPL